MPGSGSQADNRDDRRLSPIEVEFAEMFESWDITLPGGAVAARDNGSLLKDGWSIRYIFGEREGESFLEYYATHHMTNDRHGRIYDSGRHEGLEALKDFIVYDPRKSISKEEVEKEVFTTNRRIMKDLKGLGLR